MREQSEDYFNYAERRKRQMEFKELLESHR